ncbi:hypothetical protein KKE06_02775 [Candidatus Micrarchaeota archaeon]|nr:hypothetical protein [Candidatus Micrarchaeota archaeon]MBU1930883.1 hypothetical protein [Candidatus Micrarchaeota archaeon]
MSNWAKNLWNLILTLSLIFIILALLIEFFFQVDEKTLWLIHIIDIFALSFLFMELVYDFYRVEDKKKFVTKEWLLILSFLPFGAIFRVGRVLKASRAVKFLSGAGTRILRFLRLESIGLKAAQSTVHISRASRILRPIAEILRKKRRKK